MKTAVKHLLFLVLSVTSIFSLKLQSKNKFRIFEEDEKLISYRDNKVKTFTVIKPDESSSPLKLSKEQIGRFSWAVLHSMAAAYPKNPNEEEKQTAVTFLHSFAKMFPCKMCSTHFQKMLADYPIKHNSREELVLYLCDLHNKVNVRLKKPVFDCKKAFGFWGGECGCSEKPAANNSTLNQNATSPEVKEANNTQNGTAIPAILPHSGNSTSLENIENKNTTLSK